MSKMMPGMQSVPANPFQFWMQAADMWQKSCQQAMQSWTEAQSNMMGGSSTSDSSSDKRR